MPCGEITITLQDVTYQMGLNVDGDSYYEGHSMKEMCQQLLEHVPGPNHKQDASDSCMHMWWLPLLEDLNHCSRLSWGSTILAWLYRQMCRATDYRKLNLGDA
ncbi:hypothetical protein Ahy_A03g010469 [Arachis hypogaea]|uniref:Aminotransferase-like plant mobile domain-containing protein n=1 Tax=Arachis hypogaea TaxID=3818 RepID=A0A445DMD1_ARAHY|nr:hypothetical protein Ahy_A03g010469 [Arachis hypogaea]